MCNVTPLGTVSTAPDCTITFAGALNVVERKQLEETVQSPEIGGEQLGETLSMDVLELVR